MTKEEIIKYIENMALNRNVLTWYQPKGFRGQRECIVVKGWHETVANFLKEFPECKSTKDEYCSFIFLD